MNTTEKNTTPRKNTPNTRKNEKNERNENTMKNENTTIPATETTPATMNTTEKNERNEKTMNTTKKNTTKKAPRKNTTTKKAPAPEKKSTLPENIEQAKKTAFGDMKALETLLNTPAENGDRFGILNARVNEKRATLHKDLRVLNDMVSAQYYRKTPLFDIVKAGENVPAYIVEEDEKGGKYTLKLKAVKVYPTLPGMKSAGVVSEEIVNRVDVVRRVSAFVKSGNTARVYLTGDAENKKDCPNEKVAKMIDDIGEPSKNKARAILTRVFKDLTGNEYKKEVFPKLYDEFESYITKRSRKWSERNMVGKATACDMVLEFAWMYFNGMTAFKYTGD